MKNNEKIILQEIILSRINKLLEEKEFSLKIEYLQYIHKVLFQDIFNNNGNFRTYNISKPEEILNERSVSYADYHTIQTYLLYDFLEERKNNYHTLTRLETIDKIASLASRIWSVHPFDDGNTRTVGIFILKYLNTLGYNVDNHILKNNSKYFRNALVVASFYDEKIGIHTNLNQLKLFFKKLLIDESIPLDNDNLYIKELFLKDNTVKRKKLFLNKN